MLRSKKRAMIVVLIISIVILLLVILRFWWRIYPGYYFCDDGSCAILEVTDDHVLLEKNIFNLGHFFDGYKYHVDDKTLYVGYKTMFLLGSSFSYNARIEIPTEEKVEKIVLCGRGKEKVIYTAEEEE